MKLLLGVSDFGKIKSAEITLGDLVIFVGDNNSGKTFVMQLLYGVIKELCLFEPEAMGAKLLGEDRVEYGKEWFNSLEGQVNKYLMENKEKIVRKIFHKAIPVGKLYIRFMDMNEKYICKISDQFVRKRASDIAENAVETAIRKRADIFLAEEAGEEKVVVRIRFGRYLAMEELYQELAWQIWLRILCGNRNRESLFLPASRTGLQLLGKYFFAERDKQAVDRWINILEEEEDAGKNELGLTAPVYDFLQFLVRYTQSSFFDLDNRDLLKFIENRLIDGSTRQIGDELYYCPQGSEENIPLYLASSLVNEIAPIIKALSGNEDYGYVFYDEVENCLHPLKLGEMARLIIRLVNSGMRMIVSTHSDTMAGKLNNLLLLSFSEEPRERRSRKLERLGLEEEDLLSSPHVHVYQFMNQPDGSSLAEELKFQTVPYIGYDFNLFMKNLDELYNETKIVLE